MGIKKYIYKKGNKFPHVMYLDSHRITLRYIYLNVNPWCKDNFGTYCDRWFCPRAENYSGEAPYAFKNKEDAMAFKLRWS